MIGGDTIQKAAGRVAHEDAVQRGGVEACEACGNRSWQERDKSRAQAADAELKNCDAAKSTSDMEARVSSEEELKLAAGTVAMKRKTKCCRRGIGTAGRAAASGVEGAMAMLRNRQYVHSILSQCFVCCGSTNYTAL